jgi:pimeloyl-ACP methyl ester carboxylesterase
MRLLAPWGILLFAVLFLTGSAFPIFVHADDATSTEATSTDTGDTGGPDTSSSTPADVSEPDPCHFDADYNQFCTEDDGSVSEFDNPFFFDLDSLRSHAHYLDISASWEGTPLASTEANELPIEQSGTLTVSVATDTESYVGRVPLTTLINNADLTFDVYEGSIGASTLAFTESVPAGTAPTLPVTFDKPGHYVLVYSATYAPGHYPPGGSPADLCNGGGGDFCFIPSYYLSDLRKFVENGKTSIGRDGLQPVSYIPAAFGILEIDVTAAPVQAPKVSNVLFLPGIEGSRLYESTSDTCDPTQASCGERMLWTPFGDSDVNDLDLDDSGESKRPDVYAKEGDIIDSALGYNVYKAFIGQMQSLKSAGTINDWRAAAYDWRLSLPDIITKGAEFDGKIFYEDATTTPYIEQTLRSLANSSQTGKVTIIAHSNGGLVAKALLQKLGDADTAKLIDKVIFVGVPQSGAPKTIGGLLYGYGQAEPFDGCSQTPIIGQLICSIINSRAAARMLAENSPMAYHLLPSQSYFDAIQDPAHQVISFGAAHEYEKEQKTYGSSITSFSQLSDFLQAKDGGRAKPAPSDTSSADVLSGSLLDYAQTEHETLDTWLPPAGVTLYQIAGWGDDTISGVRFYESPKFFGLIPGYVPEYEPVFVEDGDGVVPTPSALLTSDSVENVKNYWLNLHAYNKNQRLVFDHGNLFETSTIEEFLKRILNGKVDVLPDFVSTNQPSPISEDSKLVFYLHSPLTLGLTDSAGNHTGLNTDGTVDQNILGSTYGQFGDVKYLIAPAGAQYQLALHGLASGTFSLDVQEQNEGVITASTTISGVPTTASTLASLTITNDIASSSPLVVDEDGNGTADITLTPQINAVVSYSPLVEPEATTTSNTEAESAPISGTGSSSSSSGGHSGSVVISMQEAPVPIGNKGVPTKTAESPSTKLGNTPAQETEMSMGITNAPADSSETQTASVYDALGGNVLKGLEKVLYNMWQALLHSLKSIFKIFSH